MFYFTDLELDSYIIEDVPYFDLTTNLAGIGRQIVELSFITRDSGMVCGIDLSCKIFEKLGSKTTRVKHDGDIVSHGDSLLRVAGCADSIFSGWKVAQNALEYSSGVATLASKMVNIATSVNDHIQIVATRKVMPGSKKLLSNAVSVAGVLPHRLGVSETVLFFEQHITLMGGWMQFCKKVEEIKRHSKEKMVIVEVDSIENAILASRAGVDIIQIDKLKPCEIATMVKEIKSIDSNVKVSVAGGVNIQNVSDYAQTGADILVTSSLYHAKPLDITTKIISLE